MTAQEIQDFMEGRGIKPAYARFTDWSYDLVTRDWFLGPFAMALKENLNLLGARQYSEQKWDCDKFSLLAMVLARLDQNVQSVRLKSIVVGAFDYFRAVPNSMPVAHSIDFAIFRKGDSHDIVFMEPQAQMEAVLTPDEEQSCFFYQV